MCPAHLNVTDRHHELNSRCLCFILTFEGWLIKSMWTGLLPRGDIALEFLSGGVQGPGDSSDDLQEELDEESK